MSTAPSPGWKAPLAMRQGRSNRPVTARHPLGLAPNSWARTVVKNGKGVQQFLRCFAPTSSPNVQLRVTPRLSPLLLYSARGREYVPSLSYANANRPWQLFEQVFHGLYAKVAAKTTGKHKFRFKNKLVSIDSTVIDLSLSMYDWAKYQRTKGAVKLHLVLDHDGYLPCFGVVTDGKVGDVKVAQWIDFGAG